jgi:uncharacterized protein
MMEVKTNVSDERSSNIVADRYTRITPVLNPKIRPDKPILIIGISDNGLVGSICLNHIITQLAMHQIASIESQLVMPAALFITKKFRHPFRIYATHTGKICAIICELPILIKGVLSIANLIIDWAANYQSTEVIVVGGISPGNFSPSSLTERKAILLRNLSENDDGVPSRESSLSEKMAQRDDSQLFVPESAFIPGLSGSLLSTCAARGISCTAIMVPSYEIPDPEGAAMVLEALRTIFPEIAVDTSELRLEAETIKERLNEYIKMHLQHAKEYEQAMGRSSAEEMYK